MRGMGLKPADGDLLSPIRERTDRLSVLAYEGLVDAIQRGVFVPGARLPSEHDLARQLQVSRGTLREALLSLDRDGVVRRRPGDGTYVIGRPVHINGGLQDFAGLNVFLAEHGFPTEVRDVVFATDQADEEIAAALDLRVGDSINTVRRLLAAGIASCYMFDAVSAVFMSMANLQAGFTGIARDQVVAVEPRTSYAVSEVSAQAADAALAEDMHIPVGQVLLIATEIVYRDDGVPLEYSRNYFDPNHFRFRTIQRREESP